MKKELNLRHRNIDGENDGIIAEYLTNVKAFYIEAFEVDNSSVSGLEISQVIELRNFLNELDLGEG